MPNIKKKLIADTTSVNVGCGSICRGLNLSKIFHLKPKKNKHSHYYYSGVHHHSSWSTTSTTATLSPRAVEGFGWLSGNSLAVEKDSNDPYVDFRESMLQMIMEKEMCRKDDLRELLNCFLQLNSPYYHGIIIRAFTEIWNSLSL